MLLMSTKHAASNTAAMKKQQSQDQSGSLAFQIIAPFHHRREEKLPVSLVTAMHSLVVDTRRPIALEIAQSEGQRSFQVRARDTVALAHLAAQLRSRYPQADLVPLAPEHDPLRLEDGEATSLWELRTGAASYLPLALTAEDAPPEHDPLLGILAALDAVPSGMRAICQLTLVPAPATWSRSYQRKAIEPALEPERLRRQDQHIQNNVR